MNENTADETQIDRLNRAVHSAINLAAAIADAHTTFCPDGQVNQLMAAHLLPLIGQAREVKDKLQQLLKIVQP